MFHLESLKDQVSIVLQLTLGKTELSEKKKHNDKILHGLNRTLAIIINTDMS